MDPKAELKDGRLRLGFERAGDAKEFVARALEQQGFMASLERELKVYQRLHLEFWGEGWSVEAEAEVLQVFPTAAGRFGTALKLEGWTERKAKELEKLTAAPAKPDELPSIYAIREMNVTEKMRLASKATRNERQILLQDISPQVLTALLGNPRLEPEEVLRMIQSPHMSGGLLQQLAGSSTWGGVYEIQRAIARSPKTPPPLAVRLLEGLRLPDLQAIAKSQSVREDIKRAALRLTQKRQR